MLHQVLLAYDGSPSSEDALNLCLDLVRSLDVKLQVLTVVDRSAQARGAEGHADHRSAWQNLYSVQSMVQRQGAFPQVDVAVGDPAEEILKWATQVRADILVLGRAQPTMLERLASTSVGERVLAEAPCAVLMPKPRARAHEGRLPSIPKAG